MRSNSMRVESPGGENDLGGTSTDNSAGAEDCGDCASTGAASKNRPKQDATRRRMRSSGVLRPKGTTDSTSVRRTERNEFQGAYECKEGRFRSRLSAVVSRFYRGGHSGSQRHANGA